MDAGICLPVNPSLLLNASAMSPMTKDDKRSRSVNLGRHAAECKICAHPLREEIERDFINWRSPAAIAKQYELSSCTRVRELVGRLEQVGVTVEVEQNDSRNAFGKGDHDAA